MKLFEDPKLYLIVVYIYTMVSEGDMVDWEDPQRKTHLKGEINKIEEADVGYNIVIDVKKRYDGDDVDLEVVHVKSLGDSRLEKL